MVLSGLLAYALTWIAGKLKMDKMTVSVIISLILGSGYYVATNYYHLSWDEASAFVMGVYGASQVVYNFIKKFTEKPQNTEDQASDF